MILDQKGKSTFTTDEINRIEELIQQIRRSKRNQQLQLRKQLRAIGFYIVNYSLSSNGFTTEDFRNLINKGVIAIED